MSGTALRIRIGPFEFEFEPDGQDTPDGMVKMDTGYTYTATALGVPRERWDAFVKAAEAGIAPVKPPRRR